MNWLEAVVGIGAALLTGGVGLEAVKWYRARKERAQTARGVMDHVRIYNLLNTLRDDTGAARCAVVRTHNGGGVPSGRTPLYSSLLQEVTADRVPPAHETWQRIPVDEAYVRAVAEMMQEGEARLRVVDLDARSRLRDIYAVAGVHYAIKVQLGRDEGALYYLSIQFRNTHEPLSAQRLAIDTAAREVRAALRLPSAPLGVAPNPA